MEYIGWILLGLGVGAFGTLIGAGGGFILMPILLLISPPQRTPAIITATSLAIVFCNAASGSYSYGRMKRIDYRSGLLFLTVGIPGAIIGAFTVKYIPRTTFNLVFGVLLIAASIFILVKPGGATDQAARLKSRFRRTVIESDGTRHEYAFSLPLGMCISFAVGFASSLLGIGGGIIHVPAMVHLLDFPVHVATATSHFILAAMALAGTIVHLIDGSLLAGSSVMHRLLWLSCLAAGVIVGAQLGAQLSNRIHGRWIMRSLAVALALVGVRILVQAFWR